MKKRSFAGLLYCEYYLVRHSCLTNILSYALFALTGWLAVLSIKHGNLGLLLGDINDGSGSIIKNKALADVLRMSVFTGVKYMPALMGLSIAFSTADVAAKDTLTCWARFEHCTPVTPLSFALVKLAANAIGTAISFCLTAAYLIPVTAALGEKTGFGDISLLIPALTVLEVFIILGQIFITLLRNRDMGMLCAAAAVIVPVFLFSVNSSGNGSNAPAEEETAVNIKALTAPLMEKAQKAAPILLAVLGGAFVLLFVSMYVLYRRREK